MLAEFRAKVDDGQVKEHPLDGVVVLLLLLRQFLLRGLSQGRRRLVLKRYGGGVTILGVLVDVVEAPLLLLRKFAHFTYHDRRPSTFQLSRKWTWSKLTANLQLGTALLAKLVRFAKLAGGDLRGKIVQQRESVVYWYSI